MCTLHLSLFETGSLEAQAGLELCVARDGFALLISKTNLSPFPRIANCATRPTSFSNKVRVKPCQGSSAGTPGLQRGHNRIAGL